MDGEDKQYSESHPKKETNLFLLLFTTGSHNKIITYFFLIPSFTTRYTSKITSKTYKTRVQRKSVSQINRRASCS